MAIQNNKLLLHRKEPQMMAQNINATVNGAFIVKDPLGERRTALFVGGATTQRLYDVDEDGWQEIQSFALAGTFGAGACGAWGLWSSLLTATGGTTSSVTLTTRITENNLVGKTIWFQSGSNTGYRVTITSVNISPTGGTSTINFTPAVPNAVANTDTFRANTGTYYVLNAYTTLAAGVFKSYDVLTDATPPNLATSGLPATWGVDGRLVSTPSYTGAYASGTATSGTVSTLTNATKNWTVNQWSNYQIRITSGTGLGQVRTIGSNTATTITVATSWTTAPDNTSQYVIESNDDFLYLLGNNAVTMYRYSISANTWTSPNPSTPRATAPNVGMTANCVFKTGNSFWADESNIQDGRYIYSFRGNGTGDLHRYDIALNTWATITYVRSGVVFGTGSSGDVDRSRIYLRKDNSNRFYYYDVVKNEMIPFVFDFYPDGVAVVGDKLFTVTYQDSSGNEIDFLYYQLNTSSLLRRIMLY